MRKRRWQIWLRTQVGRKTFNERSPRILFNGDVLFCYCRGEPSAQLRGVLAPHADPGHAAGKAAAVRFVVARPAGILLPLLALHGGKPGNE